MDDDLEVMSREESIAEAEKMRKGIRVTATAPATNSAGIIRNSGACSLNAKVRCL